jgi:hypothetical protein
LSLWLKKLKAKFARDEERMKTWEIPANICLEKLNVRGVA